MSDSDSSTPPSDDGQSDFHDEAYDHLSKPIPNHWRFVTTSKKNGSKYTYYLCPETRQRFSTYGDLMRYVHYAEEAMVSIYNPYFCAKPRKGDIPANSQLVAGPSSEIPDSDQGGEDSSAEDAKSDSENFDIPDDTPADEELNLDPGIYKLPPMDSIILLPIRSGKKDQKKGSGVGAKSRAIGFKNKSLLKGFTSKRKRKPGKRRENNRRIVMGD